MYAVQSFQEHNNCYEGGDLQRWSFRQLWILGSCRGRQEGRRTIFSILQTLSKREEEPFVWIYQFLYYRLLTLANYVGDICTEYQYLKRDSTCQAWVASKYLNGSFLNFLQNPFMQGFILPRSINFSCTSYFQWKRLPEGNVTLQTYVLVVFFLLRYFLKPPIDLCNSWF